MPPHIPTHGHGTIYEIVSPSGMRYIGSTLAPVADRFFYHIRDHLDKPLNRQCYSSRVFMDAGGYQNCEFNIISEHPDCSRDELHNYEARAIMTKPCINKNVPRHSGPLFRSG